MALNISDRYVMNNGNDIPVIGLGTWQMSDEVAGRSVAKALWAGYRLIDTASHYGNEVGVGAGVTQSGIPREDIFVTTKLWNDDFGHDNVLKAFDESINKLGLEYVDLYLIHWPARPGRRESWQALEELYKSGRVKNIGVSNYTIHHLEELKEYANITPAVNQVEFHPFLYDNQKDLLDYCRDNKIVIEAYSPLAQGQGFDNATLKAVAKKHGKSVAQIMLRWAMQHGTVPIPKSSNQERIRQNIDIFDFELSEKEMRKINNVGPLIRVTHDPANM